MAIIAVMARLDMAINMMMGVSTKLSKNADQLPKQMVKSYDEDKFVTKML
jgi:hypothetical protein